MQNKYYELIGLGLFAFLAGCLSIDSRGNETKHILAEVAAYLRYEVREVGDLEAYFDLSTIQDSRIVATEKIFFVRPTPAAGGADLSAAEYSVDRKQEQPARLRRVRISIADPQANCLDLFAVAAEQGFHVEPPHPISHMVGSSWARIAKLDEPGFIQSFVSYQSHFPCVSRFQIIYKR